jgi:hypothetical protein
MFKKFALCAFLISSSAFCSQAPTPTELTETWRKAYLANFKSEFEAMQSFNQTAIPRMSTAHKSAHGTVLMPILLTGVSLLIEQQTRQAVALEKIHEQQTRQTAAMEKIAASLEVLTQAHVSSANGVTPATQGATAGAKK